MVVGSHSAVFNRSIAAVLMTFGYLSQASADVQTRQQIDWCVNKKEAYSPDLQIKGCTTVIQSARQSGKDAAWAFFDRGTHTST
jgi:hypothetical protein